jgi:hypothetical protein
MDTDYVGVAALIVALLGAFGHFIETTHLKKIKLFCLESDCVKTPPSTPSTSMSALSPGPNSTGC